MRWETQTRAVIYNSVISALPGLYTVLPGNRGVQAMHLSPRVQGGVVCESPAWNEPQKLNRSGYMEKERKDVSDKKKNPEKRGKSI